MPFYLKVSYNGKSANVKLDADKIFIGRSSTCQIKLKDPLISNCHCLITIVDNHLVIKDLESTNGMLVNGKNTQETKLYIGDIINIGKTSLQLISKDMTPEQTFIHTNKNTQIKTQIAEISFPRMNKEKIEKIKKNSKIEPVTIRLPDDDEN